MNRTDFFADVLEEFDQRIFRLEPETAVKRVQTRFRMRGAGIHQHGGVEFIRPFRRQAFLQAGEVFKSRFVNTGGFFIRRFFFELTCSRDRDP